MIEPIPDSATQWSSTGVIEVHKPGAHSCRHIVGTDSGTLFWTGLVVVLRGGAGVGQSSTGVVVGKRLRSGSIATTTPGEPRRHLLTLRITTKTPVQTGAGSSARTSLVLSNALTPPGPPPALPATRTPCGRGRPSPCQQALTWPSPARTRWSSPPVPRHRSR